MSGRVPTAVWVGYGLAGAVHLGFQVWAPDQLGSRTTQAGLAPILMVAVWRAVPNPRGRLVGWTLGALAFCFLGDLLPGVVPDQWAFVTMMASFLLAQACFVLAFWPLRHRSFLLREPGWLIPYLGGLTGLIAVVGPRAGVLLVPLVGYGVLLTTMAVLASGLGRLGVAGGALFFVSDALIALTSFAGQLPGAGVFIMATYIPAVALLVAGVIGTHAEVTAGRR
ncbi:MAG: lysoplasmalogenase family protein [Propioniciclava sp.]